MTHITTILNRTRDAALRAAVVVRDERGQGTVEYVALILLIASVMTAVVLAKGLDAHGIAMTIVNKLKHSIDTVGGGGN
jgi:Flp pilus assembly pilin Flp